MHRLTLLLFLCTAALAPMPATALPAFPGAEGFGSETPGGRGGQPLFVTTLDDHDDGTCDADCTLREAIAVTGPRIVMFRVGGTITLDPALGPLDIVEPFITIAGQTAPGGGIQIRNDPDGIQGLRTGHASDSFWSVEIDTHDVVLRYLRIRPGPLTANPLCIGPSPLLVPPPPGVPGNTCVDAGDIEPMEITTNGANIVLDHLSLSWASDELIGIIGATDVTVQWSILSEAMNYTLYAGHFAAPPSFSGKGILTGNTVSAAANDYTDRLSIHHNAFVHNYTRNPQMTSHCASSTGGPECGSDVVNNVIYDWVNQGILSSNLLGHHFGNVMNNYLRVGLTNPGSISNSLRIQDWLLSGIDPNAALSVHHAGNRRFVSPGVTETPSILCQEWISGSPVFGCDPTLFDPGSPIPTAPIAMTSAEQAYIDVLADAGANVRLLPDGSLTSTRDAHDDRVIADIENGTGEIIVSFSDFQGWPVLASGTAPLDSDADGMPDAWENFWGFDPLTAAGLNEDRDGDGYTDVEEFLNGTNPRGSGFAPALAPGMLVLSAMMFAATGGWLARRRFPRS